MAEDTQTSNSLALIGLFVGLSSLYLITKIIYTLFFSPLAKVPGPWLNKLSRIPYIIHLRRGSTIVFLDALHKKYGPVVQFSPTDVSFTSIETAWPQIYGFRTGALRGHAHHPKDHAWLGPKAFGADNVLRAHMENHTRQRKLLSHAFSERALSMQEELLQGYVDKLIESMRKTAAATGEAINIAEYYNWTTFDVIGDLTFGHSFGNLDDLRTHSYIDNIFMSLSHFSASYMRKFFPITRWFDYFTGAKISAEGQNSYRAWIAKQTEDRLARETDRPDFTTFILQGNGEKGDRLSEAEIKSNITLLIGAGSETTASLLSGVTWLLLKNPDVMQRLKKELHAQFQTYDDMTMSAVAKSPYLQAVLEEGLRYYPPVPTGFPRSIAQGGEMVSDYFMPEGTSVCVSSYIAHHSERNFTDPDRFDPERWLGDSKYVNDKRHDIAPFSFGPHACIGRNLAYAEMRLILAKVVWSFDLELDSSADNWIADTKVVVVWRKPPLPVRVREAAR